MRTPSCKHNLTEMARKKKQNKKTESTLKAVADLKPSGIDLHVIEEDISKDLKKLRGHRF